MTKKSEKWKPNTEPAYVHYKEYDVIVRRRLPRRGRVHEPSRRPWSPKMDTMDTVDVDSDIYAVVMKKNPILQPQHRQRFDIYEDLCGTGVLIDP